MEFSVTFKQENGGWTWRIQNAQGWAASLKECMDSAHDYIDKYKIRKPKPMGQIKLRETV